MTSARRLRQEIRDSRGHRCTVRSRLLFGLGLAGCASSGSPSATTTTYAPSPTHAASSAPVAHHAFAS